MYDYRNWKHVFKLDPNKDINDQDLEKICESGTDAILVGGSDGVTMDNVVQLLARIRRYTVPCVLEVSNYDSITPGFDSYLIPTVLNSINRKWIIGAHHRALKELAPFINWKEIVFEGYCILNKNSKVASLTEADTDLTAEDVETYALMAEKMFRLPIFYIEYSGTYGNPEMVARAKSQLEETVLFYGGGIDSYEKAREMAKHADCIVVGNAVYENLPEALKTVKAVKQD